MRPIWKLSTNTAITRLLWGGGEKERCRSHVRQGREKEVRLPSLAADKQADQAAPSGTSLNQLTAEPSLEGPFLKLLLSPHLYRVSDAQNQQRGGKAFAGESLPPFPFPALEENAPSLSFPPNCPPGARSPRKWVQPPNLLQKQKVLHKDVDNEEDDDVPGSWKGEQRYQSINRTVGGCSHNVASSPPPLPMLWVWKGQGQRSQTG